MPTKADVQPAKSAKNYISKAHEAGAAAREMTADISFVKSVVILGFLKRLDR